VEQRRQLNKAVDPGSIKNIE